MKNLFLKEVNQYRLKTKNVKMMYGDYGSSKNGVFSIPSIVDGEALHVIASNGDGWDHVSVSRKDRSPHQAEMQFIKHIFFNDDEIALEYHVSAKNHVNIHPHCLHLWRPHNQEIPLPPMWMV